MEVTGIENKKSTPQTRVRDRARAERIGDLQNFLTQQPFLISYAAVALISAGFIEKMYF